MRDLDRARAGDGAGPFPFGHSMDWTLSKISSCGGPW